MPDPWQKRHWRELTEEDFAVILAIYRQCRTHPQYREMANGLKRMGLPKEVWREKVRMPAGTWP